MLASAGTLDLASLAGIAEQLEGTFTLTILDKQDNLYFVRGNNPLCLVEFPRTGLFVYASTSEILQNAISRLDFLQAQPFSRVWLEEERFCTCLQTVKSKPVPLIPADCKAFSVLPGAGRLQKLQKNAFRGSLEYRLQSGL